MSRATGMPWDEHVVSAVPFEPPDNNRAMAWALGDQADGVTVIALVMGTCLIVWQKGFLGWQEEWYSTRADADAAAAHWTGRAVNAGLSLVYGPTQWTVTSKYSLKMVQDRLVQALVPDAPIKASPYNTHLKWLALLRAGGEAALPPGAPLRGDAFGGAS